MLIQEKIAADASRLSHNVMVGSSISFYAASNARALEQLERTVLAQLVVAGYSVATGAGVENSIDELLLANGIEPEMLPAYSSKLVGDAEQDKALPVDVCGAFLFRCTNEAEAINTARTWSAGGGPSNRRQGLITLVADDLVQLTDS